MKAYGSVDELNSFIGLSREYIDKKKLHNINIILAKVQNDLFDLGADLCVPDEDKNENSLRINENYVKHLEKSIDRLNKELNPLRSFILPGGTKASSYLHVARTIARRAEREMIELNLQDDEQIGSSAIKYINRLSDFLFVAARYVNLQLNKEDILWIPGDNFNK